MTFRPANTNPAPTAQLVPASSARTPERPVPPPAAAPSHARTPAETEADDQAKRDFYAWCAGCEGFGSIF